ncbi:hypothetical protein [Rubellicoccus peritrichatus]|uniref:Uncharacterized protein n=1 Tax=Rubellicoccus peritrichatus TaxID=3080537 RepID=A0AAQ3LDW4_9BACT|nr:hypothetical protein [Puniceicoccus sp. CR14]WOO43691.1 hypothetical protein RZN69_11385 [Puniceicoccus sp. CR14]
MKNKRWICISMAMLFLPWLKGAAQDMAVVEVDLLTRQLLGGSSELDRSKYINVHSHYSASALTEEDLEQLKELNVGFGRSFDGPFASHKNGTNYPDTATIQAQSEEVLTAAESNPLFPYHTTRRIMTNNVNDAFNMQDDPKEMARYAVDILEYHYNDDTRPDFYSPLSIPFVAAGKFGEDQAMVRERMTALVAEIGKEIDQRELSTQVIGYTSAWPMMHYWDFQHWRERMQMFMDTAGPHIDGICFLMLDATHMKERDSRRSGSRVEALMDLIETYGAIKWGEPKPHAISEYGDVSHGWPHGDRYTPARSSAELNSYNHFLFSLLGRQDRLSIAVPFLTTKSPWFYQQPRNNWQPFSADLWRPDPESIVDDKPTRFLETEKMEFYRLWRDVKGHRALINCTDPDISTYAFTDETEAYICLNNFEDKQREVALSFKGKLPNIDRVELKRMFVPKQQAVIYTKTEIDQLPQTLMMEPHETIIIHISYAATLVPTAYIKTQNFYSKDFLLPITADKPLEFFIQTTDVNAASSGILRISFAREHNLSKKPQLKVNEHEIDFPDDWLGGDQANKKGGFFGAVAVPIPTGILKKDNKVSLTFPDSGGRVSTVVLEADIPVSNF